MASVYTTARGKNKKHKAKDASKNSAQCKVNKFDGDLAKDLKNAREEALVSDLTKPTTSGLTSASFRLRQEQEQRLRAAALLKCSNITCNNGGNGGAVTLSRCACHLASYCTGTCQREDWEAHKSKCKEKRKEMAEIAQVLALARERAEAEA